MIEVSDHALVRYIERICGETLEPYRVELRAMLMLPEADPDAPEDGTLIKLVVEGHPKQRKRSIVTVLGTDQRAKHSQKNGAIRRIVRVLSPVEEPSAYLEVQFDG